MILERFAIRRGSGGAGAHRGGDGAVRRIRFLEPMQASILSNRRRVAPRGIEGGGDAKAGVNRVVRGGRPRGDIDGHRFGEHGGGRRVRDRDAGGRGLWERMMSFSRNGEGDRDHARWWPATRAGLRRPGDAYAFEVALYVRGRSVMSHYLPLIGILLLVLGFALRLNPMLVATAAVLASGMLGGMELDAGHLRVRQGVQRQPDHRHRLDHPAGDRPAGTLRPAGARARLIASLEERDGRPGC